VRPKAAGGTTVMLFIHNPSHMGRGAEDDISNCDLITPHDRDFSFISALFLVRCPLMCEKERKGFEVSFCF